MLAPALTVLRSLVFPPVCEGCGAVVPGSGRRTVCVSCEEAFRPIPAPACRACARHWPPGGQCVSCRGETPGFDSVRAAFVYDGPLQTLLHAYKFSSRRALGGFLAEKFCSFAADLPLPSAEAVLAVPADRTKTAERGFHPPADLSRALARRLGIPELSSVLGARAGRAQIGLSRAERRQNVLGRFFVRKNAAPVTGRNLILVDDVLTTGSTLSECARTLKEAGAASVHALCLARGGWR